MPSLFAARPAVRPTRRTARALTADSKPLNLTPQTGSTRRKGVPSWQQQAWTYFDQIGEVRYGARYYGNSLSRLRFGVGWRESTSSPVTMVNGDELPDGLTSQVYDVANDAISRLLGADGSMAELLRAFGVNLFIAGEGYLVGRVKDDGGEHWDYLSVDQVVWHDSMWKYRENVEDTPDKYQSFDPESDVVLRVWLPHPRFAGQADSPMRAVLPLCEELLLLSASVRASALSRIPAGMLVLPNTMLEGGAAYDDNGDGTDGEDQQDRTVDDMVKHFVTPIGDPESAAAVVPFMLWADPEDCDKVRLIEPSRKVDETAAAQRQELLVRLANGVDLPPEVLQGFGASNHWSAWLIDEQSYKAHIAPAAQLFANALTEGLLRPALAAVFGGQPDQRLVVGFDSADLVTHADAKSNAEVGHRSLVLSDATLRRALGYAEDDAPDETEYVRRVALQSGTPGVMPVAAGQISDVVESLRTVAESAAEGAAEGSAPDDVGSVLDEPSGVSEGPPVAVTAAVAAPVNFGEFVGRLDRAVLDRLEVAASAAMDRAMERAGARVRSRLSRDTELRPVLASLHASEVTGHFGRDVVVAAGFEDDEDLVEGEFEELLVLFAALTGRAQLRVRNELRATYGMSDAEFDQMEAKQADDAALASGVFAAAMIGLAIGALYSPKPDAPSVGEFDPSARVPSGVLRDSLRVAGGSQPQAGGVTAPSATGTPGAVSAPGVGVGPSGSGTGSATGLVAGGETTAVFAGHAGLVQVGFVWDYGDALRQTFEPHLELDGFEFGSWDDPGLENREDWPAESHYFPGDHDGCMCLERPVYQAMVVDDA